MIDSHGPDHVSGLMQKVISALEHLERFAADSDAEEDALEQLRRTVSHLEREEAKRNEERQRVATVRERRSMDEGGKERKIACFLPFAGAGASGGALQAGDEGFAVDRKETAG